MVGKTISHYHITDELGKGGMGVVYKATDTKLDRTVALKFLPTHSLPSDDDKARFEREAKAAASLNHTNIATVYEIDETDDGNAFIAMEYVEGETLADKVKRGPLKIEEATQIASQIAEGLAAAHEKDIVHRDIKASNVMLTDKSQVKIMDFGLAKMAEASMLTVEGTTLGTVFYMSPEQARGEEVDHRADLWALGVVLYEMVSGQLPFPGDYNQAVIYSLMHVDPEPLTGLRTGVPMALEWIVTKLLAKDRANRYQSATDLLVDLRTVDLTATGMSRVHSASSIPSTTTPFKQPAEPAPSALRQLLRPLPIGLAIVLLAVGFGVRSLFVTPEEEPIVLEFPMSIPGIKSIEDPAMSPLGNRIAFWGTDSTGRTGLYEFDLRPGGKPVYREGSEFAGRPNYSPDGRWVAEPSRGGILVHRVPEGAPQMIGEGDARRRGTVGWLDNETILFSHMDGNIATISMNDEESEVVLRPDTALGHRILLVEDLFPDRRHVLISILSTTDQFGAPAAMGQYTPVELGIGDLEDNSYQVLDKGACCGKYVEGGYLLYVKTTSYRAVDPGMYVVRPFAINALEFSGPPVDLYKDTPGWAVGLGSGRTLLHSPGILNFNEIYLTRHDLATKEAAVVKVVSRGLNKGPDISPDGRLLVKEEGQSVTNMRIQIHDLVSDRSLLLFEGDTLFYPTWSHDGTEVYFSQFRNGVASIWKKRSDRTGSETLVQIDGSSPEVSPDGSRLAYSKESKWGDPASGVFLLDLSANTTRVLDSLSVYTHAKAFSGDERYLVYERFDEGQWELVVRSTDGRDEMPPMPGRAPHWDTERNRIYYLNEDRTILYSIDVKTEPSFEQLSEPDEILHFPYPAYYALDAANEWVYTVSRWGADLKGPDAILNVIQNFDRYAASLVEGSN